MSSRERWDDENMLRCLPEGFTVGAAEPTPLYVIVQMGDGGGIYDYWFEDRKEAEAYLESEPLKAIMVCVEYTGGGDCRVKTEDHT